MRDDDTLVIHARPGGVYLVLIESSDLPVMQLQELEHGTWKVTRSSDGRSIARVRGHGLGGVSRSYPLDANHLARVVNTLHGGQLDRSARLLSTFCHRHRTVVFGVEQ